MMKRLAYVAVLTLLPLTCRVAADEAEQVVIRGEAYGVWPVENLRARGLSVKEVPREKNAAWIYIEAINAFEELPDALEEAFDYALGTAWPGGCIGLADYVKLAGNRTAVEGARRAATFDRCQMPYFGDPRDSVIGVLLPNLSHFRFLSKLLVVDGRRLEAEGDYAEAMNSYLTATSMGEHVAQGHTLIEGLVGMAVWRAAATATVEMVLRRPLSIKQLGMLQAELDRRASSLPTVERGLHGEREFGPAIIDELCSRPLHFVRDLVWLARCMDDGPGWFDFDWAGPANPITNPQDGWSRLEVRIGRLILPDRAIKRHMLGYYDLVAGWAMMGAYEAGKLDLDEEAYIREKIPRWDVVSRLLLPSLARATLLGERSKTELAMTRAVVAIRMHTLTHDDEPPQDLSELTDKLPDGALIDPFSGDLLIYRRNGDGWALYSIGPDLVDDGGRPGERWDELDIVWRFPPEPVRPFEGQEEKDQQTGEHVP